MKYVPFIKSAKPRKRFRIGNHSAALWVDIESAGNVKYKYILAVFDEKGQPCYFVASEVNQMANIMGKGSHFLGLFPGDGHTNCGASDEWSDEVKFTEVALRIVGEKFKVPIGEIIDILLLEDQSSRIEIKYS
jgi:hypothetical protein